MLQEGINKDRVFLNMLSSQGTATPEIHFRADVQELVEATAGYSSKWGNANASIYFDL